MRRSFLGLSRRFGMNLSFLLSCVSLLSSAYGEDSSEPIFVSVRYANGMVFYNGEYIPAPYEIKTTEESVSINNVKLAKSITIKPDGESELPYYLRDTSSQLRAQHIQPTDNATTELMRLSRFLVMSLENSELIVLFDDEYFYSLGAASQHYDLFEKLLSTNPVTSQLPFLDGAEFSEKTVNKWRSWIAGYTPPAYLAEQMAEYIQMIDNLEAISQKKMKAAERLETLSYPLTLAGMIISVIAFGQLLQWIGKGFAEREERKPESERYLVMALLLMLGMSLIDLAWTILAGQAGIMREVNPVAAMYIDSPQQLAIFKVVATLIGFSILYIWRHKPAMQQATWWMCLVCVLVTFRWVIFNSMMS